MPEEPINVTRIVKSHGQWRANSKQQQNQRICSYNLATKKAMLNKSNILANHKGSKAEESEPFDASVHQKNMCIGWVQFSKALWGNVITKPFWHFYSRKASRCKKVSIRFPCYLFVCWIHSHTCEHTFSTIHKDHINEGSKVQVSESQFSKLQY